MATGYSSKASIGIKATAEKVWEILVNPDIIKQYLHGTIMKADWHKGGNITWSGKWKGQSYVDRGTVLIYEPYSVIKTTHWSPLSGKADKPENYHHVTYELQEKNGETTLTLIQGNSPSQQDVDSMVESSWKPILQEIKKLAESSN